MLIHTQYAICTPRNCSIARKFLAVGTFYNVSARVHVIFTLAHVARGNAMNVHQERAIKHGNGVRIETVRALVVVSIKHGRHIHITEAYDKAVVCTQ